MQLQFFTIVASLAAFAASVRAEKHIIRFENKCGKGTPQLIQGGKVLSTGEDYVSNGPFSAGIAYLQTGECLFNGEHCSLLEMTLVNPTQPGAGSSTDISLITPHAFNVPTSFSYFGGCDGLGTTCDHATCNTAFFVPDDNQVQVQCQDNNVNLLITFCGDATKSPALNNGSQPAPSSAAAHSSQAAPHSSAASHAAPSKPATTVIAPSEIVNAAPAPSSKAAADPSPSVPAPSKAPSCRANSTRRRRRSVSPEPETVRVNVHSRRRHHARNAEGARRGALV
ncbi:hypothetical protein C8Q76DRAFT_639600 [Earliella scabrosa]|nr:hypothetical protein C8Q76DRAFT_639600 [Earliella scabrosa]